jgi:hypothetical protein
MRSNREKKKPKADKNKKKSAHTVSALVAARPAGKSGPGGKSP